MAMGSALASDRGNDIANVEVTELSPDDWHWLRWIRLEALRDEPRAFVTTWNAERDKSKAYWYTQLDRADWVVAWDEGWPIGVAALERLATDEPDPRFVESVWVAKNHRRRGVMRQMLEVLEKRARDNGAPELRLWVLDTNEFVEQAYGRLDFRRDENCDQPTSKSRPTGTPVRERLMYKRL